MNSAAHINARVTALESAYVRVVLRHWSTEPAKNRKSTRHEELYQQRHPCPIHVGMCWTRSTWKKFAEHVFQCCRVARSSCEEDSDKRLELHWRPCTKEWLVTISSWRPEAGNCSFCCLSCCSGDLVAMLKCARTSWAAGLTSSLQESGLTCSVRDTKLAHKKGTRHTRGWIPLNAGQLQLAGKSNWERFPQRGSARQGHHWLQGPRKLSRFSRHEDHRGSPSIRT